MEVGELSRCVLFQFLQKSTADRHATKSPYFPSSPCYIPELKKKKGISDYYVAKTHTVPARRSQRTRKSQTRDDHAFLLENDKNDNGSMLGGYNQTKSIYTQL